MTVIGKGPDGIEIICTKGGHTPYRFGFVLEIGDRSPSSTRVEQLRGPDGRRTGYRFPCRICGHAPTRNNAKWYRIVRDLDAAGLRVLDTRRL